MELPLFMFVSIHMPVIQEPLVRIVHSKHPMAQRRGIVRGELLRLGIQKFRVVAAHLLLLLVRGINILMLVIQLLVQLPHQLLVVAGRRLLLLLA